MHKPATAVGFLKRSKAMNLPLHPIKSSFLAKVGYQPLSRKDRKTTPRHGIVLVQFKDGDIWAHLVPSWTYGVMMAAKSKGRVYARYIKGRQAVKISVN